MVHDRSRSIKYHSKKIKQFRDPADFTYFFLQGQLGQISSKFAASETVKLAAILLQQSHCTCSSNIATAKAVKLTTILLAALELNLLQQNRKYSQVSGNFAAAKLVKLAAILPERKNSQVSSNFACSEQFCRRLFWL